MRNQEPMRREISARRKCSSTEWAGAFETGNGQKKTSHEMPEKGMDMTPEELEGAVNPNYDLSALRMADLRKNYGTDLHHRACVEPGPPRHHDSRCGRLHRHRRAVSGGGWDDVRHPFFPRQWAEGGRATGGLVFVMGGSFLPCGNACQETVLRIGTSGGNDGLGGCNPPPRLPYPLQQPS